MCTESVTLSNHLILCHPLLLPPLIFSSIRVFSNEPALCIRWSKYWSFSFSMGPSIEYSRLISFRIDLCDLFAVQGTLKSLLQHRSSKASVLRCSAFFMVQLSHFFEEEKFFILMKSNLSKFFSFIDHAFSIILKKSLPNPKSQRFFSSVISYSFVLILRPVVHFKLIFVSSVLYSLCSCSVLWFFCMWTASVSPPFVEKTIFSLIELPSHFHKSKEKNKYQYINAYMWNLEQNGMDGTYLQARVET